MTSTWQNKSCVVVFSLCFVLPSRYLAQHVVLLHIVDLSGVDLPFEGVLKEFTADIKQQGADGPLRQHAARRRLVVIAGGGDAVAQDHAHQQAWGRAWQQHGKQTNRKQ